MNHGTPRGDRSASSTSVWWQKPLFGSPLHLLQDVCSGSHCACPFYISILKKYSRTSSVHHKHRLLFEALSNYFRQLFSFSEHCSYWLSFCIVEYLCLLELFSVDVLYLFTGSYTTVLASLVAQWWRSHVPMQETGVGFLSWEDPLGRKWQPHNPLQYSSLGKPKDRGAWWATVHGVTQEADVA